jgi:hypothetical protein
MATARKKRKVGITHFPLASEEARQEKVPPRRYAGDSMPGGSKGHRLSREPRAPSPADADGRFTEKGEKGVKTRGSRAGLVSVSRKVRKNDR